MLKKILFGLAILVGIAVVFVIGVAVKVSMTWDRTYDAPLPDVKLSTDPKVIEHGAYLAYGPAHCVDCHGSPDDAARSASGERVPLKGGLRLAVGPLGVIYTRNLTPDSETGIGRYSDGQLARMMRYAIKPDGRATIGPMMPFGNMSEDDLTAVLSFLRSQKPVRNPVPENEWTPLGKVVRTFSPVFKPRTEIQAPKEAPPEAPTKERGEYLARYVANCVGCHTPRDPKSFDVTGPDFAGGFEMEPMPRPGADPALYFRTPNLTPTDGSALKKFPDRDSFVARFRLGGRQHAGSPMPWEAFRHMSDTDLTAIYVFLTGLAPQKGPTGEAVFHKPG
jgi:mono/diheme cytochrome c family protein